jgi:hypothetical protein
MINLYSPRDEIELLFIISILHGEKIPYYVKNDYFGTLQVGPKIPMYNEKIIMVDEENQETAKELISDFLKTTEPENQSADSKYTFRDKIRLILEFFLFGWIMPCRKSFEKKIDEE